MPFGPWRSKQSKKAGSSDETDTQEEEYLPLEARCLHLRQKMKAMCVPENPSLAFAVTEDTIVEQSTIKFICQKKMAGAPKEDRATRNGGAAQS